MRSVLLLLCLATSAAAQDWALRSGDEVVDPATLLARSLTFYDDGVSRYSPGGSYSYTYSALNGGGTAFGTYQIEADNSLCVLFRNGFDRCDLFVRNAGRLVLITQQGERYPVRP